MVITFPCSSKYDLFFLKIYFVINSFHFQGIPGPGKYDVKGIFDPQPPKVNTEGIEVEHPPFMSQAKVGQGLGIKVF